MDMFSELCRQADDKNKAAEWVDQVLYDLDRSPDSYGRFPEATEVLEFFSYFVVSSKLSNNATRRSSWKMALDNVIQKFRADDLNFTRSEIALISKLPAMHYQEMLIEDAILTYRCSSTTEDIRLLNSRAVVLKEIDPVVKAEKHCRIFLLKDIHNMNLIYMSISCRTKSEHSILDLALGALPEMFELESQHCAVRTTINTGFNFVAIHNPVFPLTSNKRVRVA